MVSGTVLLLGFVARVAVALDFFVEKRASATRMEDRQPNQIWVGLVLDRMAFSSPLGHWTAQRRGKGAFGLGQP